MKKQIAVIIMAIIAMTFTLAWSGGKDWSIKAQYAESCSCSIPCPCTFGSSATRGHCDANGLVEIDKGHFRNVKLDGISVVMTTRLGEWAKFYVSDFATDKQVDAVIELLKNESVFGAYFPEKVKILSVDKKPIVIESRTGRRRPAHRYELVIDTRRNQPVVKRDQLLGLLASPQTSAWRH